MGGRRISHMVGYDPAIKSLAGLPQLTLGRRVVQTWSRTTTKVGPNETRVLHRVGTRHRERALALAPALSNRIYFLISFRKSTHLQNRQLRILVRMVNKKLTNLWGS